MDDDFFALGGHSLLATRLVSRARTALDVELEVRTLFEHPTVSTLADALDAVGGTVRPALRPQSRPEFVPLSYAQQRLWFLGRLEGPSPTYNIPLVLRLDGRLDTEALRAALGDVVERHETLRTVHPETDGVARQLVLGAGAVRLDAEPVDVAPGRLDEALTATVSEAFDVESDVPVRVRLLRTGPDAHVLVLTLHHIAGDGWSLAPLARDLGAAYRARLAGAAPDWEPLPVQYADYALWQRRTLGEESDEESVSARQLAFWRKALAGMPEVLDLPFDRPRPAVAAHRGDALGFVLDERLHRGLARLARSSGCTLFMVLQAAVAALLSRHGAGDDIPLGTPVAGRTDEALDDLVGFFVNTLVLRTDVSGDPTFRELLDRVRDFDLGAYANADLPFERLVDAVSPERTQSHHPLFQTMVVLQNQESARIDLPGLEVSPHPVHTGIAKFDLTFSFTERRDEAGGPAGVEGSLEFSTEVFEPATARAFTERLARLLTAVVDDPDQPVHGVGLLDADERAEVVELGRGETRDVPRTTLEQAFRAQAARTPRAVAVREGQRTLTYAELEAESNGLARELGERGVAAGDLVALALPGTAESVVAMLAVTKAGAAYLPVDPDYPPARVTYMLDDARPKLLLTLDGVRDRLPAHSVPVLAVDATASWATARPGVPEAVVTPSHPAYVIYTSGSTGKPKGVVISHGAAVHHMAWMADHLRLTPQDRVLARTSPSFDASVWETWLPLLHGA
ncbi:non-ribosomal peptide synthetase, partial [Streptomyces sp. ICBB 8177]